MDNVASTAQTPKKRLPASDVCLVESPIKSRLTTSFWKKAKMDTGMGSSTNDPTPCEIVLIRDIVYGTALSKGIIFRVTVLGLVKDGVNYLKFHAYDGTGEIAVVVYENVVEFGKMLKINGLYKLERFEARNESADYPQYTGSKFQLKILPTSTLTEHTAADFPAIPFDFVPIKKIFDETLKINSKIDVFGVIAEDFGVEQTKIGKVKRDIRITDEFEDEVLLTLWAEAAERFEGAPGMSIALRKALVRSYNEYRLLNTSGYSLIWVNPELPNNRPAELSAWFKTAVEKMEVNNLAEDDA